ncbi:RNA polymerase sigma factor [Novosphingobium sediminicola]|uniref:RNA polymerase sigma-70 factor (ECF subfamily) n=1 Tax=Novosphingobium sediminicola TaxID=563162 RepID=A0A7W6CIP9_9SPHN|nr:sigma-70 family RNA polymerase sigma factor [Novosphingobium sediminicola]MBB3953796.1 RNA polymerase sigma-70 factor (ECF subfamily) [Novosphingobium sediminicola]
MANTELERHLRMSLWVAKEILPHESRIRGWFRRNRISPEDTDELLQEAYCRLATIDAFEAIASPPAYFFSIARNLLAKKLRRPQVVSIESFSEIDSTIQFDNDDMEDAAHLRHASAKLRGLIAGLPDRCRRIVELRKIEGWSQKEIASHLGITEKAVEKQVWLGVRAIREAWERKARPGNMAAERLERVVP